MEFTNVLKNKISGRIPEFGAIFMSSNSTKEECLEKQLFGLPSSFADFVRRVKTGMVLFLFEYECKKLYGVFEAISDGEINIVPHAYSSSGRQFPAQVRVSTIWQCHPLDEHEFCDAIKENYFGNKFNFGLSKDQVCKLLLLFDSRKVEVPKSRSSFTKSKGKKLLLKSSSDRKKVSKGRCIRTESSRRKLNTDALIVCQRWLSSGDPNVVCKKPSDTEASGVQNSSAFGTSHESSSVQEFGAQSCASGSKPVPCLEDPEKYNNPSGGLTTDLGDFIPLSSPDHSEPAQTTVFLSEAGCFDENHIEFANFGGSRHLCVFEPYIAPFRLLTGESFQQENFEYLLAPSSPYRGPCHEIVEPSAPAIPLSNVSDCRLKQSAYRLKSVIVDHDEHNDAEHGDDYPRVKGLYSDNSREKTSVFSRLNLDSKGVVQEKEDSTRVDKSVKEIVEELQHRHEDWRKTVRKANFPVKENEDGTFPKRTSVFSRLTRAPETIVQDNEIVLRMQKTMGKDNTKVGKSVNKSLEILQPYQENLTVSSECKSELQQGQRRMKPLFRNKSVDVKPIACDSCTNVQMPSEESCAGKENYGSCKARIKNDKIDCENGLSGETGQRLTKKKSKLAEQGRTCCTSVAATTTPLKTYKRRRVGSHSIEVAVEKIRADE